VGEKSQQCGREKGVNNAGQAQRKETPVFTPVAGNHCLPEQQWGLVLRVSTISDCNGSHWPDSAVRRAMWM
jgi:hypothetical protein